MRDVRWMGHMSCTGKKRNAYWVFGGKNKRKRPLVRHGHRWGIILNWILKEVG